MAKNLTDFYDYVLPKVPGAGTPIVKRHLRSAVREFLEETKVWRLDLDPISTVDYRLETPGDPTAESIYDMEAALPTAWNNTKVRIVCVMVGQLNGIYMEPASEAWLDTYWPRLAPRYNYHLSIYGTREQWRIQGDTQSTMFVQPDRGTIRMIPLTEAAGTDNLLINVAVKPLRTKDEVEDNVWEDWAEVIAEGALAELRAMPGTQWADYPGALAHRAAFEAGIATARGDQVRSHARTDRSVGRSRTYD
jgi:hypothetical protein